jgi:hypothetical protein
MWPSPMLSGWTSNQVRRDSQGTHRAQRLQRLDEMTPKAFCYTRVDVAFVRLLSSYTLQVPSMALGR